MSVESDTDSLVSEARDFAFQNGLVKRTKQDTEVQIISFTLWPSRFQRSSLEFLLQLQKDYNVLIDTISRNKNLLQASLHK